MTTEELRAAAAEIIRSVHSPREFDRADEKTVAVAEAYLAVAPVEEAFWESVRPFDTDKQSPLRDTHPELWAAIRGAELIVCIPFDEFEKDKSLRWWVWSYVGVVARSVAALFNPDGSLKEQVK